MATRPLLCPAAVVAGLVVGSAALAQDGGAYARTYWVTPRAGMIAQFEAALREHAQWRSDNGDTWSWTVTMLETGQDLGSYGIRSGRHSWADFDVYDAGFGPQGLVHWNATVAPLVESISSAITTTDASISKPPTSPFTFVTVTRFHLRPGRELEFNQFFTQATEIIRDRARGSWVWESPVTGGGSGPYIDLVEFYENFAAMADPDPTPQALMVQEIGEDGLREWVKNVGQTYRTHEVYTLRLRPDLSVQ